MCLLSLELIYIKHNVTFLFQSVKSKKYTMQVGVIGQGFSESKAFFKVKLNFYPRLTFTNTFYQS